MVFGNPQTGLSNSIERSQQSLTAVFPTNSPPTHTGDQTCPEKILGNPRLRVKHFCLDYMNQINQLFMVDLKAIGPARTRKPPAEAP